MSDFSSKIDIFKELTSYYHMLTDIRRKKLSYLFHILDVNKDHRLQPEDFSEVADKLCEALQIGESSKDRLHIRLKALRLYVQILTDISHDHIHISLSEWLELFGSRNRVSPRLAKRYIFRIAAYIFNLFDQNEDRHISKAEYLDMFRIYHIDLGYSERGFEMLDENKDGTISLQEMVNGFKDFLMSSKPDAPGNWIFGNWQDFEMAQSKA